MKFLKILLSARESCYNVHASNEPCTDIYRKMSDVLAWRSAQEHGSNGRWPVL